MRQYLELLQAVLERGVDRPDRTEVGTRSLFGWQMRFDLSAGFPCLTTKRLHLRSIIHELLKRRAHLGSLGDAHLYRNHLEQARLQRTREPRPLPRMRLNPAVDSLFDFRYEDFTLEGYDPHPHIPGEIAV